MRNMSQYNKQDADSLQVIYYNISSLVCNHNLLLLEHASSCSDSFTISFLPARFCKRYSSQNSQLLSPSFRMLPLPLSQHTPPLMSCCDRGGPVPPLCRTNTHLVGKYKDLVPPESGRDQERHRASPALGTLHANPANIAQCLSSAIHPAVSPYRPR